MSVIKSIEKLLCSLSSYINLQSSDFCSPRSFLLALWWWRRLVWWWIVQWDEISYHRSYYWSDFYKSNQSSKKFTSLINCTRGSLTWLLKLAIVLIDLTFIGLICLQGNSLMNCIFGSTIYLGPDAVMNAQPSSLKFRLIRHFKITALSREIVLW